MQYLRSCSTFYVPISRLFTFMVVALVLSRLQSDPEAEDKEKQLARCQLREKFLRAVTSVVGKECTLHMYSNTSVTGTFRGNDIEFQTLLVDGLKTPLAEIPHSKIRSCDVNYIEFKNFLKP